jgi:hypothetical protein
MDPVTLLVTAVALGAASGLRDTAAAVVRDAYQGLKSLIVSRYPDVDVTAVERRPQSVAKRDSLREDLVEAGAANVDAELLDAAWRVVEVLREHDRSAGSVLGVDLDQVEAEFLRVRRVDSAGTGVRVRGSRFGGGIDIEDVHASGDRPF